MRTIIFTLLVVLGSAHADLTINSVPVFKLTPKDSLIGKWEYINITEGEKAHLRYILEEQGVPKWVLGAMIRYIEYYKRI